MPETIICPKCGNQMDAGTPLCPACGAPQSQPGFMGKVQDIAGGILATTKTHPKYWMIGGGAAAVAAIAAVVTFGGFFGFSGREICTATLAQAKDFGVLSPSAELDSSSAKSTDVKNRRQCSAKVGDEVYTLTVDLKAADSSKKKCTDLKKQESCVALWSVVRKDGMTTYQVREIPPEESDEALAAEIPRQSVPPPPGAAPPSGADAGGLDGETAVDNSGAMSEPSQPSSVGEPQR